MYAITCRVCATERTASAERCCWKKIRRKSTATISAKISVPRRNRRLKPENTEPSAAVWIGGVAGVISRAGRGARERRQSEPTGRVAGAFPGSGGRTREKGGSRDADVLVPQRRMTGDEAAHQLDAACVLQHLDLDPARAQQGFFAGEAPVLADDHARDAVQQDRSAAHRARRQGRVQHRLAIDRGRLAAGV